MSATIPFVLPGAPASPTKIVAVHLTYRSRLEEYGARTPSEPSYFLKPPSTLNRHEGVIPKPRGSRFLNYEGEVAVIVGRRMKGVPAERDARPRRRVLLRQRRRPARFPPRRPGLDAPSQGPGRLPPDRPRARPDVGVGSVRLHAPNVPERRGRPGGDQRRPDLERPVPARRPLPADHARAGGRRAHRDPGQLATDGGRRRRRGRGHRARAAHEHRRRLGRRPLRARRADAGLREHAARRARHPRGRGRAPSARKGGSDDRAPPDRPRLPARRRPRRGLAPLGDPVRPARALARERDGRCSRATTSRTASSSVGRGAGPRPHRVRAAPGLLARRRARPSRGAGVACEERDGCLFLDDPDGNGIQLMPYRAGTEDRPLAASTRAVDDGARRLPPAQARARQLPDGPDPGAGAASTPTSSGCASRTGSARTASGSTSTRTTTSWRSSTRATPTSTTSPSTLIDSGKLRDRVRPPRPARALARLGTDAPRHRPEHLRLRPDSGGALLRRALLRHGAARGQATCRASIPDDRYSSNIWGPLPPRSYFRFDDAAVE